MLMRFTFNISFQIVAILSLFCAAEGSAQSDPTALHALFGTETLRCNVNAVRRKAAGMSPEVRYEYLKNWVLPSQTHSDFRVIGEFAPADPSPLAIELEPHRFPSGRGGALVSPVFDLLETAKAAGKLRDLAADVARFPDPENSAQLRSKLVLQLLVALESRDTKTLDRLAPALFSKTSATFKWRGADYWPELHLIGWSIDHRANYHLIGTLLSDLYIQRFSIGMHDLWKSHILRWAGEYDEHLSQKRDGTDSRPRLPRRWIPVTRANSKSRGLGFPPLRWQQRKPPELLIQSGHDDDYLMFQSPLVGNYQVESEMEDSGACHIQLGGRFIGPKNGLKKVAMGTFRKGEQILEADVLKRKTDKTLRYRGVVRNSVATVFLNGREVQKYVLQGQSAVVWLALRRHSTSRAHFYNVQITGEAEIPESIVISSDPELSSWVPYHLDSESAGRDDSEWRWIADEGNTGQISGRRCEAPRGSFFESLLRYQRPLVEDGSIEYEFWYEPGEFDAHPAFDRLAFVLEPRGIRLHWLTDGKYDPTGVSPDNVVDEAGQRAGSTPLPLNANAWNRMRIVTQGDRVVLELNGQRIFERPLEATNARTFGLFHYSDRTELKVRNVVMRGDWPKSLPPVEDQELSDPLLAVVDEGLDRLQARFTHNFAQLGRPEDYFKLIGQNAEQRLIGREDGLHFLLTPVGQWNNLGMSPHFSLQGDFDIEAEFDQLQLENVETRGEIVLQAILEDDRTHWLRAIRSQNENGDQLFNGAITYQLNPEKRRFQGSPIGEGADFGRLRIARRGTDFYAMFAEGDSPVYRIVKHENIPAANVKLHGIELKLFLKDSGSVSVVLKNLSIRAEKMFYLRDEKKRTRKLFAMSPDGSNLRELTSPKYGLDFLGSPEFSADGSRIVMDMSRGPTTTSHVVIMNRDGSDMQDLGMGCMPSLSKDGKSIVFSDPAAGIVKMDADGENRETLERSGWGVQYSPDGQHIAYSSYSNFTLLDPQTGKKTPLFEGELANRYSRIYWNFGWSHDSHAIAFKGHVRATGQEELAVVDINKPGKVEVLYAGSGIYEDFTFSPDSRSVLFALRQDGPTQPDLYLAHRKTPGQIERLEGQPADYRILDCDWSPDGKQIVFAALVDPTPVEWPLDEEAVP